MEALNEENQSLSSSRIPLKNLQEVDINDPNLGSAMESMTTFSEEPNIGNHIPLLIIKNRVILTLGPNWIMMMMGLSLVSSFAVYSYLFFWQTYPHWMKIAFCLVAPTEISLYLITSLLNPGIFTRRVPTFGKTRISCR